MHYFRGNFTFNRISSLDDNFKGNFSHFTDGGQLYKFYLNNSIDFRLVFEGDDLNGKDVFEEKGKAWFKAPSS